MTNSRYTPPKFPGSAQFGVLPDKFGGSDLASNGGGQSRFAQFTPPPAKGLNPGLPAAAAAGPLSKFLQAVDLLASARPGTTASATALGLLIASDCTFTDQSRSAENTLQQLLTSPDSCARSAARFALAMRLLRSAGQGHLQKALQHLAAMQEALGDPKVPDALRKEGFAVSQMQAGLALGENSPTDYFLPALEAADIGTRAAANMNIANRFYFTSPPKAAEHYAAAVKLTKNPVTRQNAITWMRELGYNESGQKIR